MMRTVSNRVLPLAFRYGSVLLAALLVYYVIREPLNEAVSNVVFLGKGALHATEQGNEPADIAAVGVQKAVDDKAQLAPAAPVEDVPGNKVQEPMGDVGVPHEKKYKPEQPPSKPIGDHFPWLRFSESPPPVLDNNLPPFPHVEEQTPLLIGFTRNWPLLLQCVSSYIAAGWPPEDIYVVENTGTFHSNRNGDLELQNPFFLNHTALAILGIKVLETPTLLSFSQMQNYFLNLALEHDWPHFWWSHMDVMVFSDEDVKKNDRDHDWDHDPYATIYERCVGLLRYLNGPDMPPWATHFFQFDHLALVNRDAYLEVGAWDTQIPYYASDCDMYLRLHWAGYWQPQSEAGLVFDVASVFDDIAALFRLPGSHATFDGDPVYAQETPDSSEDERAHHEADLKREKDMYPWVEKEGETFAHLIEVAGRMQDLKWKDEGTRRNEWQIRQTGGRDDPFYRDPEGFAAGVETLVDAGRRVFADKWGHRGCDLIAMGIEGKDAWRLERDWDINEGPGSEGGNWGRDWMTGSE